MNSKLLALHLIKEDLKYHQMVAGCASRYVHIEFFPDLASVVKGLLGQEDAGDTWDVIYLTQMGKAEELRPGNNSKVEQLAEEVLEALVVERW